MGDEMHQRNIACSSAVPARGRRRRWRAPRRDRDALADCLAFIGSNDQFFLNIAMAMGKALTDPASGIAARRVVTAMCRNGTDSAFASAASATAGSPRPSKCRKDSISLAIAQGRQPRHGRLPPSWRPSGSAALRWRLHPRSPDLSARLAFDGRQFHPRHGRDHRRPKSGMDDPRARLRRRADRHRCAAGGGDRTCAASSTPALRIASPASASNTRNLRSTRQRKAYCSPRPTGSSAAHLERRRLVLRAHQRRAPPRRRSRAPSLGDPVGIRLLDRPLGQRRDEPAEARARAGA